MNIIESNDIARKGYKLFYSSDTERKNASDDAFNIGDYIESIDGKTGKFIDYVGLDMIAFQTKDGNVEVVTMDRVKKLRRVAIKL
jgi:hypothetical protein